MPLPHKAGCYISDAEEDAYAVFANLHIWVINNMLYISSDNIYITWETMSLSTVMTTLS